MSKRSDARLAKLLDGALEKAGLTGSPMAMAHGAVTSGTGIGALISMQQPGAPLAASLARNQSTFGDALGPGFPFQVLPLDQLGPDGRPLPRKFQYDVADN